MRLSHTIRLGLAALMLSTAAVTGAYAVTLPAVFAGGDVGTGIYIDATYAAGLVGQPGVKLVDIRAPEAYAAGHIDGAINIPLTSISIEANGLRNQVPERPVLEAIFSAAGLTYDDTLVLFGDDLPGRAFIAFDQSGFEKIHIVEGGLANWTAPLNQAAVVITPTTFVLDRAKAEIVDKDYVLSKLNTPGVVIIDSRGADDFNAGSIPGSVNIPIYVSHQKAELFEPEALVAALDALGIAKDAEIITTCGSGNVASNQLAALRDLGYTNIKLYDGSWGEWGSDPATPKTVN